jgi:hypothetical protein
VEFSDLRRWKWGDGGGGERVVLFKICEFQEKTLLACAACTFRRTSRSTSLLWNTQSSALDSIIQLGVPVQPPDVSRLVRWDEKGRALSKFCEKTSFSPSHHAPDFDNFFLGRGLGLKKSLSGHIYRHHFFALTHRSSMPFRLSDVDSG